MSIVIRRWSCFHLDPIEPPKLSFLVLTLFPLIRADSDPLAWHPEHHEESISPNFERETPGIVRAIWVTLVGAKVNGAKWSSFHWTLAPVIKTHQAPHFSLTGKWFTLNDHHQGIDTSVTCIHCEEHHKWTSCDVRLCPFITTTFPTWRSFSGCQS